MMCRTRSAHALWPVFKRLYSSCSINQSLCLVSARRRQLTVSLSELNRVCGGKKDVLENTNLIPMWLEGMSRLFISYFNSKLIFHCSMFFITVNSLIQRPKIFHTARFLLEQKTTTIFPDCFLIQANFTLTSLNFLIGCVNIYCFTT